MPEVQELSVHRAEVYLQRVRVRNRYPYIEGPVGLRAQSFQIRVRSEYVADP
ncbi:hypothetical protein PAECIP111802_02427 [Paenibacillus allorhizosphaerae]|uniref:Uncharacterized protein n=1 Tax=Paenibacillus allorhizosphaerae TaxID=2849866 RepID=A0ABM8VGE4_9BACL|nr:hypothetical protein PAECIP111802_02427 [Paenibacillus allorhizosphaerae]